MKRIQVSVPDTIATTLKHEAERRGMPMTLIVRDAVALHLMHLGNEGVVDGKRVIPFAGIGRSGRTDLSVRIDEILAEEWTKENLIDRNR